MKHILAVVGLVTQVVAAQGQPTVADHAAEELKQWLALDAGEFNALVVDSTFQIICKADTHTGLTTTGTGFLMARKPDSKHPHKQGFVLLSADHVFAECAKSGDTATILFRYRDTTSLQWVLEPRQIKIVEKNRPLWVKHPTDDVAAMPVEVPDGAIRVALPVSVLADKQVLTRDLYFGQEVLALGYPFGELGQSGFPLLRPGTITSRVIEDKQLFALSFQVYPGDSGGPVYRIERTQHTVRVTIVGLICQARILKAGESRSGSMIVRTFVGIGYVAPSTELIETINLLPSGERLGNLHKDSVLTRNFVRAR